MSVSGVTSNTFGSYAKRIGRIYLHTTFGTGADEFMTSMNKSLFDPKAPWYNPYKNANTKDFWTKFKQALRDVETHEASIRKANGNSYLKAFWEQFRTIPKVFKDEWKLGGEAAKRAKKSVFWGKIGGANKALMKRMPLIGGLMAVAFQVPNIVKAFTSEQGGLGTGLAETGKAVAKIGLDTAGFMIGQALIPIPFVGGMIGAMVTGFLGEKILGKSFAEKQAEANGDPHLPGTLPYVAQNNTGSSGGGAVREWKAIEGTMSDAELMQVQQYLNRGVNMDAWG